MGQGDAFATGETEEADASTESPWSWDPAGGAQTGGGHWSDPNLEGKFLIGDISGANSNQEHRRQNYAQQKAMQLWQSLAARGPSAASMSDPYNYDPNYEGLRE